MEITLIIAAIAALVVGSMVTYFVTRKSNKGIVETAEEKANLIITKQKHEVEESRKEILDSIHYAKRIQKAHLPTEKQIEKNLNRLQNKG